MLMVTSAVTEIDLVFADKSALAYAKLVLLLR